ncbi:MAG: hypothetical protein A2Z25_18730 [Planctomycetes bacterium RBG_16_55_9]|nr:MAG: hypothetical protein A2Z25_18730 [Planctomycetes bacterium RBG_16_55_9]
MSKDDSDAEILEFAISKEVEAYYFYLAVARRVENLQIRELLENLAVEELGHKERLELEMIKSGRTVTAKQRPLRPDSDYILSDSDAPLDMEGKDVLLLGIEKEEASFRMYVNFVASVRQEQSQDLLLALAEEEVKHKIRFEAAYDELLRES